MGVAGGELIHGELRVMWKDTKNELQASKARDLVATNFSCPPRFTNGEKNERGQCATSSQVKEALGSGTYESIGDYSVFMVL
jgi:hypothetical protein